MATNVFYATTSYHLLLSTAIAKEKTTDKNVLIFNPGFHGYEIGERLLHSPFSPFSDFYTLPRWYNGKRYSPIFKLIDTFRSHKFIRQYRPIKKCYVTNNSRPVAQHIMGESQSIVHVEDGLAAYTNISKKSSTKKEKIARIMYGPHFVGRSALGLDERIQQYNLTYPRYASGDLRRVQKQKIDHRKIEIAAEVWAEILSSAGECDFSDVDMFVALPHSSGINKSKQRRIEQVIEKNSLEGKTVIKYHPNDEERYLSGVENTVEIDSKVPAEVIYGGGNISKVVGGISTALYSAKIICDTQEIYLLRSDNRGSNIYEFFEQIDIGTIRLE